MMSDADAKPSQIIQNQAPNQGVQGIFNGPVTLNVRGLLPNGSLHQLRAAVGDFVGRQVEIDRLVQTFESAAENKTATIGLIQGMAGSGKTELAYKVIEQTAHLFSDANLLISLQGTSSHPLTQERALQTVIRAFEPNANLPDDRVELQAHYRTLLYNKRVLILADDALDGSQINGLLPPPGCALLVTSRNRFAIPGMTSITLEPLPQDEAVQLLIRICPRIGNHAISLARLCGDLPLALRISAGVLVADDTRNVKEFLRVLADERTRLQHLRDPDDSALSVEAALCVTYEMLDATAQRVLRQISIFPTSFSQEAAEYIVKSHNKAEIMNIVAEEAGISHVSVLLPPPIANDSIEVVEEDSNSHSDILVISPDPVDVPAVLGLLRRRSLIDWDEVTARYQLHELVRLFAEARLQRIELARLIHAEYFMQVAWRTDELYKAGNDQVIAGLALFDQERLNIDSAWQWALSKVNDKTDDIDYLLIHYAQATIYTGELRYHKRRERIPQFAAALAVAQRWHIKDFQITFLGNLGLSYAALGEYRQAIMYYEQALDIAESTEDQNSQAIWSLNLGNIYYALGDIRKAVTYYEKAKTFYSITGNREEVGKILGNLGVIYATQGDTRLAIKYYEEDLAIAREVGNRFGESTTLGNLGNAYRVLGDYQRALEYHKAALEIVNEIGDEPGLARTFCNIGNIFASIGEPRRAIDFTVMLVVYLSVLKSIILFAKPLQVLVMHISCLMRKSRQHIVTSRPMILHNVLEIEGLLQ